MVEVGVYLTRHDAELAQAFLFGAGIASRLEADDAGGAYPFLLGAGARLLVDETDVDAAIAVLTNQTPTSPKDQL
jgi:hypothetical protein